MPATYETSMMNDKFWKISINFALTFHVIIIAGAIYLPGILKKTPEFEKIYTLDLVNIEIPVQEEAPQPEPVIKQEKKQAPPPAPKPEKAVSIAQTEVKQPPPKPVPKKIKPISIKPRKQKKKKIIRNRQIEALKKKQAELRRLEKLHRQRILEAERLEREAQMAADLAATEAVQKLKQMLHESDRAKNRKKQNVRSTTARNKKQVSAIEGQYFSSIYNALQPHWKLPGTKTWPPDLTAVLVIRINANGNVIDRFFEKKSGDRLFDQFVLKTIQDAAPLPAIPRAMNKQSIEIGLKFKPGIIQY